MKYLVLVICMFFVSCGVSIENRNQKSVLENTTNVASDYADTLENSIGNARSAVEGINDRQVEMTK